MDGTKLILTYYASHQLRNFFFDPQRSRHLYSVPWIIGKCWDALECALEMQINNESHGPLFSLNTAFGLEKFFLPKQGCQISSASLMLAAETIKNGSDSNRLLGFLKFLSRIRWLDISFHGESGETCTQAIAQWVCIALVS
jgi:hypothetical protein